MRLIFLTYLFSLSIPFHSWAQETEFYLFNVDNGLPTNEVYAAYETADGLLYIGHDLGLSVYDGIEFKSVEIKGVKEGTSCYGIYKLNGKLWFKFIDQLYFLEGTKVLPYHYNSVLKKGDIGIIYHFSFIGEELFVSTGNKGFKISQAGILEELDYGEEKLVIDRNNNHIVRQTENGIDTLHGECDGIRFNAHVQKSPIPHFGVESNQNNIYWNASSIFYFQNDSIQSFSITPFLNQISDWIISLSQINNTLYISTKSSGVLVFEYTSNQWNFKSSFLSNAFTGIISIGKSGKWIPIVDKGLAFVPNENIRNYHFEKEVKNIYLSEDTIFVATMDQFKNAPIKSITSTCIIENRPEFDWTEYNHSYLEYLVKIWNKPITPETSTITGIILPVNKRICYSSVHRNVILTKDYFLQATNFYISVENINNGVKDTIWISGIQSFTQSKGNSFIIGGEFGLSRLIINGDGDYEISNNDTKKNVHQIQKLENQIYSITNSEGIYLYRLQDDHFEKTLYKFDEMQLKSSFLKDNLIFLGTSSYLLVMDTISKNQFVLDRSSGVSNTNISNIFADDSILVISHEKGVSTIPMEFIRSKLKTGKVDFNNYLNFETSNNSINVSFDYYNLNPWSKTTTQYSLNDNDYITFSSNEIQLSNLETGSYSLKIRLRISNGKWIELNTIYFEIPAPFYQRWWFSGGIVLIIATIVILIIKRRNTIKTKNLETEKLIETLRMNALTSQMNPHFLYNALNTIQGLLSGDKKLVFMYVSDLARFFRMMLNNSSELYIPVRKEIELNKIFCDVEAVRQYREVNFVVNYEDEELKDIKIPSMIIQPFVENAMWHAFTKETKDPEILINVSNISDSVFQIAIQDNGIGISNTKNRNKVHQSKGVSIVENRLKIFNSSNQTISKNINLTDRKEVDPNLHGTLVLVNLTKTQDDDVQDSDY